MDVREIMSSPVQTLRTDDTLNCAAKMMRDHAVGFLPIVDEGGKLAGVLTDRDIALAAWQYGEALWRLPIGQSMHRPVWTCQADDGVDEAARIMREHRVHRLPVVDVADNLVGLISLDDLAHASRQPVLDPTPGMASDELGDVYDATSGRSKHPRGPRG